MRRVLTRIERREGAQAPQRRALAVAWNDQRHSIGDQVALVNNESLPSVHPYAWDPRVVIKDGFQQVGLHEPRHSSNTHRSLELLGVSAFTALFKQRTLVDAWASSICSGTSAPPSFVLLLRECDATPVDLEFGALQELLLESAKCSSLFSI